jgi:hypothetical protein
LAAGGRHEHLFLPAVPVRSRLACRPAPLATPAFLAYPRQCKVLPETDGDEARAGRAQAARSGRRKLQQRRSKRPRPRNEEAAGACRCPVCPNSSSWERTQPKCSSPVRSLPAGATGQDLPRRHAAAEQMRRCTFKPITPCSAQHCSRSCFASVT